MCFLFKYERFFISSRKQLLFWGCESSETCSRIGNSPRHQIWQLIQAYNEQYKCVAFQIAYSINCDQLVWISWWMLDLFWLQSNWMYYSHFSSALALSATETGLEAQIQKNLWFQGVKLKEVLVSAYWNHDQMLYCFVFSNQPFAEVYFLSFCEFPLSTVLPSLMEP